MDQLIGKYKKRLHFAPKPHRLTSFVMMLVIITGVMSALFAGISADLREREYLRGRAGTIAAALTASDVKALTGTTDDLENHAYRTTKQHLNRIQSDNPDLSFVYLMGQQNQQVIFLVDSTDETNPDFSPPGEPYNEATKRLQGGFYTQEPFIEGPSRDKWGVWLSALAPVIDPVTNQTIALVGIDTPATSYYFDILIYALVPLCLAAIPLAGLIRDRKLADKEWEMAQLKNQFVSIASHELRSPLTGLLWAIQSLLKKGDKNLTPPQKTLLADMFKSVESSTATINEILDLSVFERDSVRDVPFEIVQLVSTLQEVRNTLRLGAREKHITIKFDQSVPNSMQTRGDPSALKRVFMNIMSNSIKYGFEDSTITITYAAQGEHHVIAIRDQGIGIPVEEQAKVLNGYYRAGNTSKVQVTGTGIGLWITRLIVEEHGGKLWLESHENKGTTIFVSLPSHTAPSAKS